MGAKGLGSGEPVKVDILLDYDEFVKTTLDQDCKHIMDNLGMRNDYMYFKCNKCGHTAFIAPETYMWLKNFVRTAERWDY